MSNVTSAFILMYTLVFCTLGILFFGIKLKFYLKKYYFKSIAEILSDVLHYPNKNNRKSKRKKPKYELQCAVDELSPSQLDALEKAVKKARKIKEINGEDEKKNGYEN